MLCTGKTTGVEKGRYKKLKQRGKKVEKEYQGTHVPRAAISALIYAG